MKSSKNIDREYRILAIAVIFFFVGLFFFIKDGSPNIGNDKPTGGISILNPSSSLSPSMAKFPSPSKFPEFAYDSSGINNKDSLEISSACHDAYLTILIFPANLDYRQDVSKAVYNKAFLCDKGKPFVYELNTSEISTLRFGTYYFITADQGTDGTWYDPR